MVDEPKPKQFNKCLFFMLFPLIIIFGSLSTIFNKIMQKLKGKSIVFENHRWISTLGMFQGEIISIFFYIYILYKRKKKKELEENILIENKKESEKRAPTNLIYALSALCDLLGFIINTFSLIYLNKFTFQIKIGLKLLFVCLLRKLFLKSSMYRHNILGIGIILFGFILIRLNSLFNYKESVARNPLLGIILLLIGEIFSSTQYVLQEKFIKNYDVHPFKLVGFEGIWGFIIYTIILIIFQFVSCDNWKEESREEICFTNDENNSHLEDTIFAFKQMGDNVSILIIFILYDISIATYNIVGINLTKLTSSTARVVIECIVMAFIWLFFLFFSVAGIEEEFHLLQFIGFLFIIIGVLIYTEILVIPFWKLDYYTRENIAKREKEEIEEEENEENEKIEKNRQDDILLDNIF